MEEALKTLAGQGVVGAILVILLLTIAYLQRAREREGEARLKETREVLISAAETNRLLAGIKDALTGITTQNASLTSTVSMIDSYLRNTFDNQKNRDDRVERIIEDNKDLIRDVHKNALENTTTLGKILERLGRMLRGSD